MKATSSRKHAAGKSNTRSTNEAVTKEDVNVVAHQHNGHESIEISKERRRKESRSPGRGFDTRVIDKDLEEELYIKLLLARRSMHLPRNNWCQDWTQFIKNNHVLFGLCCHHPLHPLKLGHRVFILIGSIAFGLTATNSVYLWYAYNDEDMNQTLVQVSLGEVPLNLSVEDLQVTNGMLTLWTFGSMLHSIFDVSLWFITACICFLEGNACGRFSKLRSLGSYVTVAIVAIMVALSSFVIAGRAIYEARLAAARNGTELNEEQWTQVVRFESFSFLLGYGVESALTYFVFYPLIVTIGISGMLSPLFRIFPCIKFLGGRSEELLRQFEERKAMAEKRRKYQKQQDMLFEDESPEEML